jgi:hypothetical protein
MFKRDDISEKLGIRNSGTFSSIKAIRKLTKLAKIDFFNSLKTKQRLMATRGVFRGKTAASQ